MMEKILEKSTALLAACPCQSGLEYGHCCAPYHQGQAWPKQAQQLMRARYCAYTLGKVEYIVATTLPAQQPLLDKDGIAAWADSVQWTGLRILACQMRSKIHENVEFEAYFQQNGCEQIHHERSLFVKIGEKWYFLDHSLPLPPLKQACLCGSGKKFKHCCVPFLSI